MPRNPRPAPLITPTQLTAAMAGVGLTQGALADALGITRRSVIQFLQGGIDRPRWLPGAMRLLAGRGVHFGPFDGVSFGRNAFGDRAVRIPKEPVDDGRGNGDVITPAALRAALARIGMSQVEFARRVGASQTSVSLFLAGRRGGALWLSEAALVVAGRVRK